MFANPSAMNSESAPAAAAYGSPSHRETSPIMRTARAISEEVEHSVVIQRSTAKSVHDVAFGPGRQAGLHRAATIGDIEKARRLLDEGASVELRDASMLSATPLMTAAAAGDLAMMDLLLERGASMVARDAEGDSVRDYPQSDHREAVDQLLDHHARRRSSIGSTRACMGSSTSASAEPTPTRSGTTSGTAPTPEPEGTPACGGGGASVSPTDAAPAAVAAADTGTERGSSCLCFFRWLRVDAPSRRPALAASASHVTIDVISTTAGESSTAVRSCIDHAMCVQV